MPSSRRSTPSRPRSAGLRFSTQSSRPWSCTTKTSRTGRIVLFSDGDDRNSFTTVAAVEQRIRASQATVYVVTLGRGRAIERVRTMLGPADAGQRRSLVPHRSNRRPRRRPDLHSRRPAGPVLPRLPAREPELRRHMAPHRGAYEGARARHSSPGRVPGRAIVLNPPGTRRARTGRSAFPLPQCASDDAARPVVTAPRPADRGHGSLDDLLTKSPLHCQLSAAAARALNP